MRGRRRRRRPLGEGNTPPPATGDCHRANAAVQTVIYSFWPSEGELRAILPARAQFRARVATVAAAGSSLRRRSCWLWRALAACSGSRTAGMAAKGHAPAKQAVERWRGRLARPSRAVATVAEGPHGPAATLPGRSAPPPPPRRSGDTTPPTELRFPPIAAAAGHFLRFSGALRLEMRPTQRRRHDGRCRFSVEASRDLCTARPNGPTKWHRCTRRRCPRLLRESPRRRSSGPIVADNGAPPTATTTTTVTAPATARRHPSHATGRPTVPGP